MRAPELRCLRMRNCSLTDEKLSRLPLMAALQELDISSNSEVSQEGIVQHLLPKVPLLQTLNLARMPQVPQTILFDLVKMRTLGHVGIANSCMNIAALRASFEGGDAAATAGVGAGPVPQSLLR